jgi:hypothetical protein
MVIMGSCFAENMGSRLVRYRFPVTLNPFGTIFNPASVAAGLENLMKKEAYRETDLREYQGTWLSFDHYTGFSSPDQVQCLERINSAFLPAKKALKQAGYLIITWGTSWVYTENEKGKMVSNCHKIPASDFTRSKMNVSEIVLMYKALIEDLIPYNPNLKILLTVSPVRHWKDGAHGNQLSKAALLLATEVLRELFPERVFYFPSYELVLDELRDYRFYAADMIHTNEITTAYIWEKFSSSLVADESQKIIRDLDPWLKLEEHRPSALNGPAFERLQKKRTDLKEQIQKKYPFLAL